MDKMLDKLVAKSLYCFLDGYSGYNHILITFEDQENTMFTCTKDTLHLNACCLDHVMHWLYFKDACQIFQTW